MQIRPNNFTTKSNPKPNLETDSFKIQILFQNPNPVTNMPYHCY